MKEALKLGLILGLVSIASTVIMTFLSTEIIFSMKSFLVSLVITAVTLIWGGRYFFRRIPDIDLSYGVAVKYLFIAAFIGSTIGILAVVVAFGKSERMEEAYMNYQMKSMEYGINLGAKMSGSEDRAEEMMDEMREKIESGEIDLHEAYPYRMNKLPSNIGMSAVMSLIYSLIFALFVRVKHPD